MFIVNLDDNTEFRQQVNRKTLMMQCYQIIATVQVRVTQCRNPERSCGGGDLVLQDYDTYCHQVGFFQVKINQSINFIVIVLAASSKHPSPLVSQGP